MNSQFRSSHGWGWECWGC